MSTGKKTKKATSSLRTLSPAPCPEASGRPCQSVGPFPPVAPTPAQTRTSPPAPAHAQALRWSSTPSTLSGISSAAGTACTISPISGRTTSSARAGGASRWTLRRALGSWARVGRARRRMGWDTRGPRRGAVIGWCSIRGRSASISSVDLWSFRRRSLLARWLHWVMARAVPPGPLPQQLQQQLR